MLDSEEVGEEVGDWFVVDWSEDEGNTVIGVDEVDVLVLLFEVVTVEV